MIVDLSGIRLEKTSESYGMRPSIAQELGIWLIVRTHCIRTVKSLSVSGSIHANLTPCHNMHSFIELWIEVKG